MRRQYLYRVTWSFPNDPHVGGIRHYQTRGAAAARRSKVLYDFRDCDPQPVVVITRSAPIDWPVVNR